MKPTAAADQSPLRPAGVRWPRCGRVWAVLLALAGFGFLAGACQQIQVPSQTTTPSIVGFIEQKQFEDGVYRLTLGGGRAVEIDSSEVRQLGSASATLDAGYVLLYGEDSEGPWYLALAPLECGSSYELDGPAVQRGDSIVFTTGLELPTSDRFVSSENGEYGSGHFCVTQSGVIYSWHNTGI